MNKIERFENILAWQKARELNKKIYTITNCPAYSKDNALRDQIRRASISIMANIAEGFGRRGDKVFKNFLNIAHGSAAELQSHLYISLDMNYISDAEFSKLYEEVNEVSKMINGFVNYLRNSGAEK